MKTSILIQKPTLLFALLLLPVFLPNGYCQETRNPVVFLHGWNSDGTIWDNMARLMKASEPKWNPDDLKQLSYYVDPDTGNKFPDELNIPIQDLATNVAQQIKRFYTERGGKPVDIVSHSLGGILVRTMLAKELLPKEMIHRWIAIASPHYGQPQGNFLGGHQAAQMNYGSRFLWELAEAWSDPSKSLRDDQVLCIAGILNNDWIGDDGLVKYWSATLGSTPIRYVNRRHASLTLRLTSIKPIYSCLGVNEEPDDPAKPDEADDARDAVFQLVHKFLTDGTVVPQNDADFTGNGGWGDPLTPHGAIFLKVVDATLTGIPYSLGTTLRIVTEAVPSQRLEGHHGSLFSTSDGNANEIGVELLSSSGLDSFSDQGLVPATYTLIIKESKDGTNPSFKKTGITVAAGRTTVVKFSPVTGLDFVFCIDSTGSMSDDIDAVKASANEIINEISSSVPDYRIAVVDYRDFPVLPYGAPGDYTYNDRIGFSRSSADVASAVNSITIGDGKDTEESVYSALAHCIDGSSLGGWRKNANRVILVMGDAPPHDPEPFTGYTLDNIIAKANEGGFVSTGPTTTAKAGEFASASTMAAGVEASGLISIWPLMVGSDSTVESVFGALATGTGGTLYQAGGAADVVEAIKELIKGVTGGGTAIVDVTTNATVTFNSWTLDRSSGAMIATITLRNDDAKSGIPLEKAFWYAITESTNIRLATVSGSTNGMAYYDVTSQVEAALPSIGNGDLRLDVGESVTFTVPIYTRNLSIPVGHVYGIWADPPTRSSSIAVDDRPHLAISSESPGTLTLSWAAAKNGFVVETADTGAMNWTLVPFTPQIVSQRNTVTVPVGTGARFFRLRKN